MDERGCARFGDELAEVALGVRHPVEVDGLEEHLAACASCRDELDSMSAAADRLVLVAAPAEPPAGFAERAVAAITTTRAPDSRPGRRRPLGLAVAAAVLLVVLAAGAWFVVARDDGRSTRESAVSDGRPTVRLVATDGATVGGLTVSDGAPPTMTVWLDGARSGVDYHCEVVMADGSRRLVGTWRPSGSYRSWTVGLGAAVGSVRRVEVSLADGTPVGGAALSG